MIGLTKTIDDPNGIVSKLIFEDEDAIAEAVVYQYEDRGVVCFSVQSGCPVGCTFCGTGKRFIRNLNLSEIMLQVDTGLNLIKGCKKKQLMSMSMGEPMYNMKHVSRAWDVIRDYGIQLFVSTVGIRKASGLAALLSMGKADAGFGLQFSLHHWNETFRRRLLGNHSNLMSIEEITHYAQLWKAWTGKQVYFNYICTGKETYDDAYEVSKIVKGQHLTCSVLCSTEGLVKAESNAAQEFANKVLEIEGCEDVTVFDPAGQDTIGGGCGQLLYVQEKLKGEITNDQ